VVPKVKFFPTSFYTFKCYIYIHNIVFKCALSSGSSPSVQLRQYTDQVRIPLFHTTVVTWICGQGTKQIHHFLISERVSYSLTFYCISPPA